MIGQLGCRLFRSPKVTDHALRQKLAKYERTTKEEGFPRPLRENVEGFQVVEGRARLRFLFDYVFPIPYREGTQKVLRTAVAEVGIVDPPGENIYYVYGPAAVADGIRARLSFALAGTDDFIEKIVVPADRMRGIIAKDVLELKYCWWDGIDTHARKGALKGNLLKSKFYSEFKKGQPISMTFESKSSNRTIRLSVNGSITIYGKDLKASDVEEYVEQFVLKG